MMLKANKAHGIHSLSAEHLKLACGLWLMGFLVHRISQEATLWCWSLISMIKLVKLTAEIKTKAHVRGTELEFCFSGLLIQPREAFCHPFSLKSIWMIQGCWEKWWGGYSCQPADGRPQPGPPAASEELISIRLRLWYWLLLPIHGNTTGGLLCWDKVATLPACKCVICKWFRVFLSPSMVPNWTEHKQCWVCSRFKLSKLKKKKKKSESDVIHDKKCCQRCFRCWFV